MDGGRLVAVIDFGDITSGDPATDLSIAWTLLPPAVRAVFRKSARITGASLDDDTWRRARGWALLFGLAFLATSRDSALMASLGQAAIKAVLTDSD